MSLWSEVSHMTTPRPVCGKAVQNDHPAGPPRSWAWGCLCKTGGMDSGDGAVSVHGQALIERLLYAIHPYYCHIKRKIKMKCFGGLLFNSHILPKGKLRPGVPWRLRKSPSGLLVECLPVCTPVPGAVASSQEDLSKWWMGGWMCGCVGGCVGVCVGAWVGACVGGWVGGWINVLMDLLGEDRSPKLWW